MTRIVVEEVEENTRKRKEWNKNNLEEVEFIRKGKVVTPTKKILQDFTFTGLSPTYFVEFYDWDKGEMK